MLCLAFVVSSCLALSACDGGETYTVEAVYDKDGGVVKFSPQKDAYRSNEDITVTVEPNDGYEVGVMMLNADDVTDTFYNNNQSYTFRLTRNSTLKVEWQRAGMWLDKTFTWKITEIDYPTTAGKVSVEPAPSAENGKYADNAQLSVVIEPVSGAVPTKVFVDGTECQITKEGDKYIAKFNITKNAKIRVDFDEDLSEFFMIDTDVSEQEFMNSLGYGVVLCDFYYTNCEFCNEMEPDLEEFLASDSGVKIVRVKVGEKGFEFNKWCNQYYEQLYANKGFPMFLVFKDKKLIKIDSGSKTAEQLQELVTIESN